MLRKLLEPRIWRRIYIERMGEPLLYNLVSLFVGLFGSIVKKIEYDMVPRQPYAFALQKAFEFAAAERARLGIEKLVFIEFGVASGAGLLNMCRISKALSKHYGMECRVIGFDTGEGMPAPVDYRDHPEKYLDGDFVPHDNKALQRSLPENARIIYGPIAETVGGLDEHLQPGEVIGFVSIDVDYWSSSIDCMKLFEKGAFPFLPRTPVYFDDVNNIDHHPYAGELLAINDFNQGHAEVKLAKMNQIRNWRIFKGALWLDQLYWYVDFRHRYFTRDYHAARARTKLSNPYLGLKIEKHVGP